MSFLQLIPAVLGVLVLGAHLLRNGWMPLVPLVLLTLPLLFLKQGWVARFFQALLTFTTVILVLTAALEARDRVEAGLPWLRMALILSGVALFTLFAAALFESQTLRRRYPRRFTF